MHRRSRNASTAESRIRTITQAAPDAPSPSPEAPVPIPPPPYAASEPPPPEPPPEPGPPPRIQYADDGMLGPPYAGRADEPPGPEPPPPPTTPPFADVPVPPVGEPGATPESRPSFAAYDDGPSGPLARLRNLVTGDELDPGRPGLRVLVVVGVVAVLVGGWYWWRARPHQEPLPAPSSAGARQHPLPGTPSAPASASPSATAVVVDVAGKVRHPGVVHLPPGSRVVDAIHAAGGAKRGTPTGALNLARVVADGEQIRVGASGAPPPGPAQPSGSPSPGTSEGRGVSLNSATQEQLESLSGVGPVLAKHILEYRTKHGGFRSVDELRDVTGIGPKRFADLKSEVTP